MELRNENAKKFIKTLDNRGGKADTTTIRKRVGLSRSQVQYYYNKLEDMGLIEIKYAEEGYGDRDPPKVAVLTDKARSEIKKGLLGGEVFEDDEDEVKEIDEDYVDEIEELKEKVHKLENQANLLSSHGVTNEEELSNKIESVLEKIEELELEDEDYEDIASKVNELEDYMENWMITAQAHIEAFEKIINDELGVRLEEYVEREETELFNRKTNKSNQSSERSRDNQDSTQDDEDVDFEVIDDS